MGSRLIGLLMAVAVVATPGWASELDEVLAGVVTAYGGTEAVDRLVSYRIEGTTRSQMLGATGELVREYRSPDKLKVVIEYPQKSEVRILDGEHAWRGAKTGVRPVEGPMRAAMDYQLLRSELPGVLLRNRDRLVDGGTVDHEDGKHRMIILKWSEMVEMRYWVEEESSRITHVESTLTMGDRKMVFATAYDDFRTVAGVLFPFRETNYASGRHVANTVVERLITDPDELGPFMPPHPAPEPTKKPGVIEG